MIAASFFGTEEHAQRVVYEVAGFRARTQHLGVNLPTIFCVARTTASEAILPKGR